MSATAGLLNTLDLIGLLLIAVSAALGVFRGLVREVLSLLVWLVAGWAALHYHAPVLLYLQDWVPDNVLGVALAAALCFVLVFFALSVLLFVVVRLIKRSPLKTPDRTLGGVFGLIRGAVMLSLLAWVLALSPLAQEAYWQQARMMPQLAVVADQLMQGGYADRLKAQMAQWSSPYQTITEGMATINKR